MVSVPVIERISLMADAAGSITNGFNESTIQIIIRGMCWFHCKKATDRQLIRIKKLEKRSEIIQCIIVLQLIQTFFSRIRRQ